MVPRFSRIDAACTRAIIIDRGQIVANGTPAELKSRSTVAGAVTVRVAGQAAAEVAPKLNSLPTVGRTNVVEDGADGAVLRAFPSTKVENGDLARSLAEFAASQGWKLAELHTEEGRLDEVFRSITRPDTLKES